MISKVLGALLLFLIVSRTTADTISSSTEAHSEVTTRSSNRSDDESTTANTNADQREWRPSSNEEYTRSAAVVGGNSGGGGDGDRKVVSIDLATLNKYRRGDGNENYLELDQQRRRYFDNNRDYNNPEQRYRYENNAYQRDGRLTSSLPPPMSPYRPPPPPQLSRHHQPIYHRYPLQDEIYPVQVQGCSHLMRDVSRFQPPPATETSNRGILQGWLGGSVDGEGSWRPNNGFAGGVDDGKRYNPSTSQVTTATPKIAPAYRNRDYSKYEFGHDKANDFQFRPKYGDETKLNNGGGSGGRDYYDQQNRDTPDRNVSPWSSSPHRNRNTNRIVYYEYNLDDKLSPPLTTDSRLRGDWNNNDKCARGHNHIVGLECEPDWFTATVPAARNTYHRFDDRRRFYTRDDYARMNTVTPVASYTRHEYPTEAPAYHSANAAAGYFAADDSYRYRNNGGGRGESPNGVGIGYVYSLDLPADRRRFGSPGSAYAADTGFMRPDDYRQESMAGQLEQQ